MANPISPVQGQQAPAVVPRTDNRTVTARAHETRERSIGVVPAGEMQRWPQLYSWIFLAGLVVVGVLVVFAYLPGLHGSFYYDDFRSITQNRMLRMTNFNRESFRLLHTGPGGDRPVSLFSFALHSRTTRICNS